MNKIPLLEKHITAWYHQNESTTCDKSHLAESEIFRMALPGGLATADEEKLDHLSLCPVCMDRWDELCTILGTGSADDFEENEIIVGQGFLRTGSGGTIENIRVKSKCSRFILSIYPSENENSGTAVLEIGNGDRKKFEGALATICDTAGEIIIQGPIRGGVLARKLTDLHNLDLKQWSTIITVPKGN